MPSDIGRSLNGAFKYLRDRVWKRIQGWIQLLLSAGGKDILIKSVVQAIPTYSMSCFKLPRGLCLYINSMIKNFLVGQQERQKEHTLGIMGSDVFSQDGWGSGLSRFTAF
jgi:hypothetical protein